MLTVQKYCSEREPMSVGVVTVVPFVDRRTIPDMQISTRERTRKVQGLITIMVLIHGHS